MGLNWAFVAWGTANFTIGLAVGSHYWDRYHQKRNRRLAKVCHWLLAQPAESIHHPLGLLARDLEDT